MRPVIAPFVLEARRRGLLKVATAYLIVTWLVLEIGHTLFLVFDLPHRALQFIFVLLALGFPVVLLGVWQGWFGASAVQGEAASGEAHASAHHEGPWLAVVFGTVALFAVAVAIGVRFFGMGRPDADHAAHSQPAPASEVAVTPAATPPAFKPPAHSIAVMPFANMSGDPQQEYFSDGLSEELLNSLVRISELKVVARTSAFAFKGKNLEVGDIARRLNVGAILAGSVRTAGKRVRITVQLIDAANGYHLWSQTYDRQLDDIFEVQADIATNVVQQLQGTLLGNSTLRRHTPSSEAYVAYLRGRDSFVTLLNPDKAIAYYEQALQLDEHYADAMMGLAEVRFGNPFGVRAATDVASARQLIDRAIAIEPQLTFAYVLRAHIATAYDFDWAAADRSLKQARELEPNNLAVVVGEAYLAETLGQLDEAATLYRQVLERDPMLSLCYFHLGRVLFGTGKQKAAEENFRKVLELAPQPPWVHYAVASTLVFRNEPEKALAEAKLEPVPEYRLLMLAGIYQALDQQEESDAALRELTQKYSSNAPFLIAEAHAMRGDVDQAMRWLDQAYRNRDGSLTRLFSSPLSHILARDPRYQAFLRKMNLPTDAK